MAERRTSGTYSPRTPRVSTPRSLTPGSHGGTPPDDIQCLDIHDPSLQAADRFVAPQLDKEHIVQCLLMGRFTDVIELFHNVQNPGLDEHANALLLSAAAADVRAHAFANAHPDAYANIEKLLQPLIREPAPEPDLPAEGASLVSPARPDAKRKKAFDVHRAVRMLAEGRYDGKQRAITVIFGRRQGPELIHALNQAEDHLAFGDTRALSDEQRETAAAAIRQIRSKETYLSKRKSTALPALRQSTTGALNDRYSVTLQKQFLNKLDYGKQNLVIEQTVSNALDEVLLWYRDGGGCPALLLPDDPAGSVDLLRQQAAKRQRDGMDDYQRQELAQAIDRYKAELGTFTSRDRADLAWVKLAAAEPNSSPSVALQDLRNRLAPAARQIPLPPAAWDPKVSDREREDMQTDAAVAQALLTALTGAEDLDEADLRFLYKLIALLVEMARKPLKAIANPMAKPGEPHTLNPINPHLSRRADARQRARYNQGIDRAADHQRLAMADMRRVLALLPKLDRSRRVPGGGKLFVETTLGEQCAQLLVKAELSPSRVRHALYLIAKAGGSKGRVAAKLLNEMRYSMREATGSNVPMTAEEILRHILQVLGNGLMEGGSHYVASVSVSLAALAMGPTSTALVLGSIGLQMFSLAWLQQQKTAEYDQQQSRTAELLLATPMLVAPASLVCAVVKMIHDLGLIPVALPATFGRALLTFVIVRYLRQILQSWLRNGRFAGFQLRHADGSGLSADEQFHYNIVRDAGYVVLGGLLLYFGPALTTQVLEALGVVAEAATSQWGQIVTVFVSSLWAALAEFLDGGIPDWARLGLRFFWGDEYMLQPGTQVNPGRDFTHFLKNATARGVASGLTDFFYALHDAMLALEQPQVAELFRVIGVVWNGLAGSLRGRFVDYLTTGETLAENGSKNPAGLMTALGLLGVYAGQGMADAACGLAASVKPAVAGVGTEPAVTQAVEPADRETSGQQTISHQEPPESVDDDAYELHTVTVDGSPVGNDPDRIDPVGNDPDVDDPDKEFYDWLKNNPSPDV